MSKTRIEKLEEEVTEWKDGKPYSSKALSREAEKINEIIDFIQPKECEHKFICHDPTNGKFCYICETWYPLEGKPKEEVTTCKDNEHCECDGEGVCRNKLIDQYTVDKILEKLDDNFSGVCLIDEVLKIVESFKN